MICGIILFFSIAVNSFLFRIKFSFFYAIENNLPHASIREPILGVARRLLYDFFFKSYFVFV